MHEKDRKSSKFAAEWLPPIYTLPACGYIFGMTLSSRFYSTMERSWFRSGLQSREDVRSVPGNTGECRAKFRMQAKELWLDVHIHELGELSLRLKRITPGFSFTLSAVFPLQKLLQITGTLQIGFIAKFHFFFCRQKFEAWIARHRSFLRFFINSFLSGKSCEGSLPWIILAPCFFGVFKMLRSVSFPLYSYDI